MTFNEITKQQQEEYPDVEGNYPNWKYTQELYNRIELVEEEIAEACEVDLNWILDNLGQVKSFIEALQPLEENETTK